MEERITRLPDYSGVIAQEMGLTIRQVQETIRLLDEGNTIPFMARYRKEATGSLDEEVLRQLAKRYSYLKSLADRKEEVARLIAKQEKLTPALKKKIEGALLLQQLEDLYRPFRPRRRTRGAIAREKGLEPLSQRIWKQEGIVDLEGLATKEVDPQKGLGDVAEVLQGVKDILSEMVADDPGYRALLRPIIWKKGHIVATGEKKDGARSKYEMYFDFKQPLSKIPPHRVLAINRGQKEGELKVTIQLPIPDLVEVLARKIIAAGETLVGQLLFQALEESVKRLLGPSLERECWRTLWERAEEHAIGIFTQNLRRLLLQPPLGGRKVLAIDPAYRTGCKVALMGPVGEVQENFTIYPHAPVGRWQEARERLKNRIVEQEVSFIAIGNGTASRETEELVSELVQELKEVKYTIIDEAGASVYSASPLAKEELPGMDVEMRGAVSIGRRLQDPLAELVKIHPRSLGVGLYQHDLQARNLEEALEGVVESCVNYVGVDLNTASPHLLQYVAGINRRAAQEMVKYRLEKGPFQQRGEIRKIKGVGPKTFEQAAGFLHLFSQEDPLARTPIHPESYDVTLDFLKQIGFETSGDWSYEDLIPLVTQWRKEGDLEAMASQLEVGGPTLDDIVSALLHPGRDPREDLPPPLFHERILRLEDLEEGMLLWGTVRNVVDFGAFVDLGIEEDGLIHISQLGPGYVKHPLEVVGVGDVVEVKVRSIDVERKRIGLSLNQ